MSKWMQDLIDEGKQEGRQEGMQEGILRGRNALLEQLVREGYITKEIADAQR